MSLDIANNQEVQDSLFYIIILSIFGSAFAKILFNKFIQIASPVFASSVTYTLPVVAVMWGFVDGETISIKQFFATSIILVGVFLANKKTSN